MSPGFALPLVLFAISISSALAVGGAYVTRQFAGSARAGNRALELEGAAERALVQAVASWDSSARESQPIGSVVSLPADGGGVVEIGLWVTRTTTHDFWLVGESSGGTKPLLRRRLGVLIRLDSGRPLVVSRRAWSDLP